MLSEPGTVGGGSRGGGSGASRTSSMFDVFGCGGVRPPTEGGGSSGQQRR